MNSDNDTQSPLKVNIFADNAYKLFENGYNVLPLRPSTKIPATAGWQNWCENKQTDFQVDQWCNQHANHNIGIPLGIATGIIAIDFDYDVGGMKEKVESLLDGSPIKKRGNKGYTAFYRFNGEHPKKWGKDGKMIVELLSTGNQTVVPPSVHPDTKEPYVWLTEDTLFDMTAQGLPMLPDDFIQEVDKLFGRERVVRERNVEYDRELPPLSDIEKALGYIPSMEYSVWLTVGMAIKFNYGDAGFDTWDAWSRTAPNYSSKGMDYKWSSFGKYGGQPVTIGSLFDMAMNHGYIPESFINITDDFLITVGDEIEPVDTEEPNFPKEILEYMPGLPGEMARWIDSVSSMHQPVLSLGASIAACGTIYSQRIISGYSGERPNIYTMGTCRTGAGKDEARKCIKVLFEACGIYHNIIGDPASDVGLVNSLHEKRGVGFILMDEIGKKLQSLIKSKNSHEGKILDTTMELFTSSSSSFLGKEYADRAKEPVFINAPHLSIYGTTTKRALYDALDSGSTVDGFLNRWLLFEAPEKRPRFKRNLNTKLPPQTLIDNINKIQDQYEPTAKPGMINAVPDPIVIDVSDGAIKILQEFSDYCYDMMEALGDTPIADLWARSAEMAGKIALICHPYKEKQIESVTAAWSVSLVKYLTGEAVKAVTQHVSDNEHEKDVKRTLGVIERYQQRNKKPMPHSTFCNFTNYLNRRNRNDIIIQLAESGLIDITEKENKKGSKTRFYGIIETKKGD